MTRVAFWLFLFIQLISPRLFAFEIPTSTRSQQAIIKVKPQLEAALKEKGLSWGAAVFIRIFKKPGELEVWIKDDKRYKMFRSYDICRFSGGLGPKLKQGDDQAPEGFYSVIPIQLNPVSQFHLAFNIGYPNAYDRAHGRTGGHIMVHGNCVSIGCFAMRDYRIEEIYALMDAAFRNGQKTIAVHIFPFPLNDKNMAQHEKSPWLNFWRNLKEGYEAFEKHHEPPRISVQNKRYVVAD